MNPFGHIDLRVTSMEAAMPFYSALLPALGFTRTFHSPEWKVFATPGELPSAAYFALKEDPSHMPNGNRIAFWAGNREEVDGIAAIIRPLGAKITSGPKLFPEYQGTYYALYFEDPSGNRLEVVYRTA